MNTALERSPCEGSGSEAEGWLAVNPWLALQYHYGMLLGVDDLETEQGYHRGKHRLHQAWLHGPGAVWGLDVTLKDGRELLVTPGLAVDGMGRELHLDSAACLDLGKWYAEHQDDGDFPFEDAPDGGRRFSVRVVARFDACRTRPVPAIADPCDGDGRSTGYSRVFETVALDLRPAGGDAPAPSYPRLRILFDLAEDDPGLPDVVARRDAILALPAAKRPREYLAAFREFAALDSIERTPQLGAGGERTSLFPEDPSEVVLAEVRDAVVRRTGAGAGDRWRLAEPLPTIDTTVRPSHVATRTIQELLCGPRCGAGGDGAPGEPAVAADEAPRVVRESVDVTDSHVVRLSTDRPLEPRSVEPQQFSVTAFTRADGWRTLKIREAALDQSGRQITLTLADRMGDLLVRIIARGTGPRPLLGSPDLVPLAGATGDPPAPPFDGRDFVHMVRR